LFSFFTMISNTYNLYIDGSIKLLSDKEGNYYNPQVVLLINFEMIVNILFLLFTVIVMFYLFKKKRIYPKLAIALIVIGNIIVGLDTMFGYLVGLNIIGSEIAMDIGRLIAGILWISYFIKSRRIKNTFVN